MPNYAGNVYNDMLCIIVRPSKNMPHLNEDFIKNSLWKGAAENYFKVMQNKSPSEQELEPGILRLRI